MIRSLRWRMQVWFTGLLLLIVLLFGIILYHQAWRSKLRETDAQLESGVLYLDAILRGYPPFDMPDKPPPKPKGPPGFFPRPKDKAFSDLKLPRELEAFPGGGKHDEAYFFVWRPDGRVLRQKGPMDDPPSEPPGPLSLHPKLHWRGDAREAWLRGPHGTRILVGRSFQREQAALHAFGLQIAGISLGVVSFGSLLAFFLSLRLVRPLATMAATAGAISVVNLGERLKTEGLDSELASLATVLNDTFARLEVAFERQIRFTADASHELRTPLAIIRSQAELALARPRSEQEYRRVLDSIIGAAARMGQLVQGLLTLARADARCELVEQAVVDLDHLTAEVVELLLPLAREKNMELTAELVPATVLGDAAGLSQVVMNLVQNAIQYSHAGGNIRITLQRKAQVVLSVEDQGIGIPKIDQPHLFERFFRVDRARSRAAGGAGLGLAICKTIVTAHGGTIDFTSEAGRGSTFRVHLPYAAIRTSEAELEREKGDSR